MDYEEKRKRFIVGLYSIIGFSAFLHFIVFQGSEMSDPHAESLYMILLFIASVIAFLYACGFKLSNLIDSVEHGRSTENPVRSDWEIAIERRMRQKYPGMKIVTNDRSIIPSRNGQGCLEIDFWLPDIRLAIEANGESYHDHSGYRRDLMHGTCHTEERYKEVYCQNLGITFLHIWSSQDHDEIDNAIERAVTVASTSARRRF